MDPQERGIFERFRRRPEQLRRRRPAHPPRKQDVRDRRRGRIALENDYTA
jgi:hypothetical protein